MRLFSIVWGFVLTMTLCSQSLQAQTVKLDGQEKSWTVKELHLVSRAQCEQTYCDQFDTDCDGTLDSQCSGLEYDICSQGGIVAAYVEAAFTGACIEKPVSCNPGELVVSPAVCVN